MSSPPSRVAVHEAGHAVTAVVLRFVECGPVSVVGAEGLWAGICVVGRPDVDSASVNDVFANPLPLVPAADRTHVEGDVMVTLAGDLAEELFEWAEPRHAASGAQVPPADDRAELPRRDRLLIASARAGAGAEVAPHARDADLALDALLKAHRRDSDVALAHWRLLVVETRRLLLDNRRAVLALARHLDEHGTLSAASWRAVVAGHGTQEELIGAS